MVSSKIKKIIEKISNKDLTYILHSKKFNLSKVERRINYEEELVQLQIELVKLQKEVLKSKKRIAIIIEGRDAAGKGGAIRRFTHYLNPRNTRVVALPKPSKVEKGQWYFQRYIDKLPNEGEIVFFDRSWYNRAIVEPVNDFCTQEQYEHFMNQVLNFEKMLVDDGVILIKLWFSISKEEQAIRFKERKENPLKQWKFSPVDQAAQEKWDDYTKYKNKMFEKTNSKESPWVIIKGNNKQKARLESIRYVLSQIEYESKNIDLTLVDPKIIKFLKASPNK